MHVMHRLRFSCYLQTYPVHPHLRPPEKSGDFSGDLIFRKQCMHAPFSVFTRNFGHKKMETKGFEGSRLEAKKCLNTLYLLGFCTGRQVDRFCVLWSGGLFSIVFWYLFTWSIIVQLSLFLECNRIRMVLLLLILKTKVIISIIPKQLLTNKN